VWVHVHARIYARVKLYVSLIYYRRWYVHVYIYTCNRISRFVAQEEEDAMLSIDARWQKSTRDNTYT
jgi:hypothetical protein